MDSFLKDFYFFSEFLNRRVFGPAGQRVGKVVDLVAERGEAYPMIIGLVVLAKGRSKRLYLPWEEIARFEPRITSSGNDPEALQTRFPEKESVLLREEVIDKQIVDTYGAKVVRVNDLHFLRIDFRLRLIHVDVGFRGLMRRVGWEKVMDQVLQWLFS